MNPCCGPCNSSPYPTGWLTLSIALRFLLALGIVLTAALLARSDTPTAAEIERLIKQLGDDDFDRREAAAKRLDAIGEPALEAVRKARDSDDPEVRQRAREVVRLIERRVFGEELALPGHTSDIVTLAVSPD